MGVFIIGAGMALDAITATPENVLSGKTYNDSDGNLQTGTMANQGSVTCTLGYGSSYTTAGYYSSINITAPGRYGNAGAGDVLTGKTFMNTSGNQTGTMANKGSVTCALGYSGTYTGAAGYYSSIKVTSPGRYGNAGAGDVFTGKTFMNTSGNQTGTMANKGSYITNLVVLGKTAKQWANSGAGYYSSVNVGVCQYIRTYSGTLNGYWLNSGLPAPATGWWGGRSANTATSFKLVNCGGYVWFTRNEGSNSTIYITTVTNA